MTPTGGAKPRHQKSAYTKAQMTQMANVVMEQTAPILVTRDAQAIAFVVVFKDGHTEKRAVCEPEWEGDLARGLRGMVGDIKRQKQEYDRLQRAEEAGIVLPPQGIVTP